MILDISDERFKSVFDDEKLFLPIRWDGSDFEATLRSLFNCYIKRIEKKIVDDKLYIYDSKGLLKQIKRICGLITSTVNLYFNGFPSKAYKTFEKIMECLKPFPIEVFRKELFTHSNEDEMLYDMENKNLFRVVGVEDNKPYKRERIFHTPYNLRSKVATCRYSIAGYPSLYLGTSLELCCEEMQISSHQTFTLASVFKLEDTPEYSNAHIRIIEMGIKPQDFFNQQRNDNINSRYVSRELLSGGKIKTAYLLWYPLIASCSYIRVNKKDPFAAEYIIPQLLMQWVRISMNTFTTDNDDKLIGIRYFSCASEKTSDMGFNYVFPTSGPQISCELPYCSVLAKAFRLTEPKYIHEYDSLRICEADIQSSMDLDFISET